MPRDEDRVFRALADAGRRVLLDRLHEEDGQTLRELCRHLDMTRQAVTKHLAVLEAANLVVVAWRGREKLHYLNPVPIEQIGRRWIGKYERRRVSALVDLQREAEGPNAEASVRVRRVHRRDAGAGVGDDDRPGVREGLLHVRDAR